MQPASRYAATVCRFYVRKRSILIECRAERASTLSRARNFRFREKSDFPRIAGGDRHAGDARGVFRCSFGEGEGGRIGWVRRRRVDEEEEEGEVPIEIEWMYIAL